MKEPKKIVQDAMNLIRDDWFLVSAQKNDGSVNTMTAQWGMIGYLWRTEVAMIFVRPQRFTHEFVMESNHFSLSFFDESYKDMMKYMGKVSGRDENKIEVQGLKLKDGHDAPVFHEAKATIVCEKMYVDEIQKDHILLKAIDKEIYPTEDYHTVLIGRVKEIL